MHPAAPCRKDSLDISAKKEKRRRFYAFRKQMSFEFKVVYIRREVFRWKHSLRKTVSYFCSKHLRWSYLSKWYSYLLSSKDTNLSKLKSFLQVLIQLSFVGNINWLRGFNSTEEYVFQLLKDIFLFLTEEHTWKS